MDWPLGIENCLGHHPLYLSCPWLSFDGLPDVHVESVLCTVKPYNLQGLWKNFALSKDEEIEFKTNHRNCNHIIEKLNSFFVVLECNKLEQHNSRYKNCKRQDLVTKFIS